VDEIFGTHSVPGLGGVGPAVHPFETVAATGLRRGEVLGLRWSDIDLTERFLLVNQQVKACNKVRAGQQPECPYCGTAHGGLVFDMKPKSRGRKNKPVELEDRIVGALLLHKLAQDAEKEEWGDA
jgi:integrase